MEVVRHPFVKVCVWGRGEELVNEFTRGNERDGPFTSVTVYKMPPGRRTYAYSANKAGLWIHFFFFWLLLIPNLQRVSRKRQHT